MTGTFKQPRPGKGSRHGRWAVIRRAPTPKDRTRKTTYWLCRCDCGTVRVVSWSELRHCHSCGCYRRERVTTHGASGTPTFRVWQQMIRRCYDKRSVGYPTYGKIGIKVCPQWRRSFVQFRTDMGERPLGRQIDRLDNAKGYSPANCRWATLVEQANNKRNNVVLTARGQTKRVWDWAREVGTSADVIRDRVKRYGWSPEEAIFTPLDLKRSNARKRYFRSIGFYQPHAAPQQ